MRDFCAWTFTIFGTLTVYQYDCIDIIPHPVKKYKCIIKRLVATMTKTQIHTAQTTAFFIGVSFGLLPLLGNLLGKGSLLLNLVFPGDPGVWAWWIPLLVIAGSAIAVVGLEEIKSRSS